MADENIYDEFKEPIPVAQNEFIELEVSEAFPPIGQTNNELNHALLNNRDIPNQHPITAIEGLRDELDNIESLKTEYSDKMGFANYYPWKDGGGSEHSREGYFVTVSDRERRIKICDGQSEVFGVTISQAGFIGNQDGIPNDDEHSKYGVTKNPACGSEYGLVAHSGIVNVHCNLDVTKNSYVISDDNGYAKVVPETDGGYGFKVIAIDWKDGFKYAVISLDASINQLHALGKEALEIRTRMTGLEKNVTTAVNVANQALSKVNDIGEANQGISDKVDEIANAVDDNNQQIADANSKADQAVQQAQQAQQTAQEISNQVVENAKVEMQQLKEDVEKAQEIANKAQSTASSAALQVQSTKEEIQSNVIGIMDEQLGNINSQLDSSQKEFNKTIEDKLAESDEKYQGKFLTIEGEIGENEDSITNLTAFLNKSYQKIKSWEGDTYTSLDGTSGQPLDTDTVYYDGTNYYYIQDNVWQSTTDISVAGLIGSITGLKQQVDENGASVNSIAQYMGKPHQKIKSWENTNTYTSLAGASGQTPDKNVIYYDETQYYYFEDGEWRSSSSDPENGLTSSIALIDQKADKNESSISSLTTWKSTAEENIASIQQKADANGASIDSLVANISMYAVGDISPICGLSYDEARTLIPAGMVFCSLNQDLNTGTPYIEQYFKLPSSSYKVITKLSEATDKSLYYCIKQSGGYYKAYDYDDETKQWVELKEDNNAVFYKASFNKERVYVWKKNGDNYYWEKQSKILNVEEDSIPSNTAYDYWYYPLDATNINKAIPNDYIKGTLYKSVEIEAESDSSKIKVWIPVAKYGDDNYFKKTVSLIHQTADEISLAVKSNKDNIAAIKLNSDDNESMINLLCSFTGENYEKVDSFSGIEENNRDKTKVYYSKADRKFYYFKDPEWKSTTNSYEAGITDAIANIKMLANEQESVTQLINTYVGKTIVDAVMCDSEPTSMETGIKYCYQNGDSYICQYTDGTSTHTYPEESDLESISNVVLNAIKKIETYTSIPTWTNEQEDSTETSIIYYVQDQDKYYHYDDSKLAWLPMQIRFYFIYDTTNKKWELQDSSSISFMQAISLIQSKADSNGARLDMLLSGDKNNASSLAAIIAEATGGVATIDQVTQWIDKSMGLVEVDKYDNDIICVPGNIYYEELDGGTVEFWYHHKNTGNWIRKNYTYLIDSDCDQNKVYSVKKSDNTITYYYCSNNTWKETTDPSEAGVVSNLADLKVQSDENGSKIEGLTTKTTELGRDISKLTLQADSFQTLVANIDKYSVGEYSQAVGLSLEEANNILYNGMVFVPLKDVKETYEYTVVALTSTDLDNISNNSQNFFKDKKKYNQYCYTTTFNNVETKQYWYYNGENWASSNTPGNFTQSFSANHVYEWGNNAAYGFNTWNDKSDTKEVYRISTYIPAITTDTKLWYYNGTNNITDSVTGQIYKPKTLCKCVENSVDSIKKYWTPVASADENSIARSLSQIRQTSNEIALEVSDAKGQVASIKTKVDNMGAQLLLTVGQDGKVNAGYIQGTYTGDKSKWEIGANNINIDGTITVTNTYNTNRSGKFKIYDFANGRNPADNYWLKAEYGNIFPFSVDETGFLTATKGKIGGWTIGSTYIGGSQKNTNGITQSFYIASPTDNLTNWIRAESGGDIKFSVSRDGILTAKNADIAGTIKATDGTVGGWKIDDQKIYSNVDDNYVVMQSINASNTSGIAFAAGATKTGTQIDYDTAGFLVYEDGMVKMGGQGLDGYITVSEQNLLFYKRYLSENNIIKLQSTTGVTDESKDEKVIYYWKEKGFGGTVDDTRTEFIHILYYNQIVDYWCSLFGCCYFNIEDQIKYDKANFYYTLDDNKVCTYYYYDNDMDQWIRTVNSFEIGLSNTKIYYREDIKTYYYFNKGWKSTTNVNSTEITKEYLNCKMFYDDVHGFCIFDTKKGGFSGVAFNNSAVYTGLGLNPTNFLALEHRKISYDNNGNSIYDAKLRFGCGTVHRGEGKNKTTYPSVALECWNGYGNYDDNGNISRYLSARMDIVEGNSTDDMYLRFIRGNPASPNGTTIGQFKITPSGMTYVTVNASSTADIKTNISTTNSMLSLFKPENSQIYSYNLKKTPATESSTISNNDGDLSLDSSETINLEEAEETTSYGFVIGEGYTVPSEVLASDGEAINLYSMASINWKATQELYAALLDAQNRITELENQLNNAI